MFSRIILLFVLTIVALPTIIAQHYINLTLFCNDSENDIHFEKCDDLEDLFFDAGFNYVIEPGGMFTWQLYRNGILINEKVQVINYKSGCIAIPELPNYSFQTSSISGTYELKLFYENYSFIGASCSGVFLNNPSNSNDLILYSNKIKVTRFDDNSESKCETNPDYIQVNCNELNLLHEGGTIGISNIPPQDVKIRARQTLTSDCVISPNGYNVTFVAGTSVSLKPGFSSGNNFRAYLDDCDDGIIIQRIAKDETELEDTVADIEHSEQKRTMLSHQLEGKFIIYPNPTTGIININVQTLNQDESLQLRVFDVFGKEIINQPINNSIHQQIDVSPYGKGVYFLQVINHNQERVVKKAVVQ